MKYLQLFSILLVFVFASCKKGDIQIMTHAPTDLVVTAIVSNDSSGNVAFTATAKNAVSYEYDFGNGFSLTVHSGVTNYKYAASGTYTVTVTASSSSGQSISKTLQVTVIVVLKLKWSDEFEVDGPPDPSKWGYDLGAGGWGNAGAAKLYQQN